MSQTRNRWILRTVLSGSFAAAMMAGDATGTAAENNTKTPAPAPIATAKASEDLPAPAEEIQQEMLRLHNEFRKRNGLPPLRINRKLTAAAQRFADFVHRTGRFGHYADGNSPAYRIEVAGYEHGSWAENMAWSQETPAEAMDTWLNSGGHRGNIMSGHKHVGFGKVGTVWVTVFANPTGSDEDDAS